MTTWFASALMRGIDEGNRNAIEYTRRAVSDLETLLDYYQRTSVEMQARYLRVVDRNCELGAENEHLRDYRDRVEAALV